MPVNDSNQQSGEYQSNSQPLSYLRNVEILTKTPLFLCINTVTTQHSVDDGSLNAPCTILTHANANTVADASHQPPTTTSSVEEAEVNGPDSDAVASELKDTEGVKLGSENPPATLVSPTTLHVPQAPYNCIEKQLDWLEFDDSKSTITETSTASVYSDVDNVLNLFSDLQVCDVVKGSSNKTANKTKTNYLPR